MLFNNYMNNLSVALNNSELGYNSNHKTIINDTLNDNEEIKEQYKKTCIRSNTHLRKFNDCSFEVKNDLFKSFCAPIFGRGLWCSFNKKKFITQ